MSHKYNVQEKKQANEESKKINKNENNASKNKTVNDLIKLHTRSMHIYRNVNPPLFFSLVLHTKKFDQKTYTEIKYKIC